MSRAGLLRHGTRRARVPPGSSRRRPVARPIRALKRRLGPTRVLKDAPISRPLRARHEPSRPFKARDTTGAGPPKGAVVNISMSPAVFGYCSRRETVQIRAGGGLLVPVRIYAHLSWTTFARLPLIDVSVGAFLEKFLAAECQRQAARLLELGLLRDHVHLLLELPGTFNVARLVQGLKGASSRIANRDRIAQHASLRWAAGYDLRSVGRRELDVVRDYVRNQATRHPGKHVVGLDEPRRSDPCAEAPARPHPRPEGRPNIAPSQGAP